VPPLATPAEAELAAAAAELEAGRPVAVPTDTVYGLAADPRQAGAGEALFALKGRPPGLALPVLVAGEDEALALTAAGPARRALAVLAARFWPGPLTIVVPQAAGLGFFLGGDGDSVGLRCPGHPLLLGLLARSGPLAVTSANRHGEPPCTTAAEVRAAFAGEQLRVLDGGRCDGAPSTVVSLLGTSGGAGAEEALVLLRPGPLGLEELRRALEG